MAQNKKLFAFFPYVRTRKRCRIRGIEFRSIDDLEGLESGVLTHVETLGRMFYTSDGARITAPTFAVLEVPDDDQMFKGDRWLTEVQLLIAYLYGAPHPTPTAGDDMFLSGECSTLFTFMRNRVPSSLVLTTKDGARGGRVTVENAESLPASDFIEGYQGFRNREVPLWVAEGSRIYPPIPHLCLNYSQNLDLDIQRFLAADKHWAFRRLFDQHDLSWENQKRVFTSLVWYSRSCEVTRDAAERLLSLAIALETLLALENGDRLTERFKDAVMTLVGPVARLDEWLDQFYKARSTAVHEGRPHELLFKIPDSKKGGMVHRALITYGRRIFRTCLTTIVTGVTVTEQSRVASLLVHNNERLQEICKLLADKGVPPQTRLLAVRRQTEELHECETLAMSMQLEEGLDTLRGASRLVLLAYRGCKTVSDAEVDRLLEEALGTKETRSEQANYETLKAMTDALRRKVRVEGSGTEVDEVVLRFLEFASRPAVALDLYSRAQPRDQSDSGSTDKPSPE